MKTTLLITEKSFIKITDDNLQRKMFMTSLANTMLFYHTDFLSAATKGHLAQKSTVFNESYIVSLFRVSTYMYQYYDVSQTHFDLLDYAATQLIGLYQAEMKKACGTETEAQNISKLKLKLADYLYMTAMLFQTAADKTENETLVSIYIAKAEEYSQKADALVGIAPQVYLIKMQQLYQQYSQKEKIAYVQEFLTSRVHECQLKIEENARQSAPRSASSSFSSGTSSVPASPQFFAPAAPPSASTTDEAQPLLTRRNVGPNPLALDS